MFLLYPRVWTRVLEIISVNRIHSLKKSDGQDLREEVSSRAHSLTHTHTPHQSPNLGIRECHLESLPDRNLVIGLASTGLHFQTPNGVVALDGFQETRFVWVFGHEHGRYEATADCCSSLAVKESVSKNILFD